MADNQYGVALSLDAMAVIRAKNGWKGRYHDGVVTRLIDGYFAWRIGDSTDDNT